MSVRAPRLVGVLERRLLVNYRLDPQAAQQLLPTGMRPDLASGYAVGGICLVRNPPAQLARGGRPAQRERGAPDRRLAGRT
jgi:hypothetical protein